MADLKQFAEQLVNLTVKEVNELATILKDEYGIEPAAAAVVVAGGGDAAGGGEEKSEFDVVLKDAGATALYGSQANAGVIIITTKNAKQEGMSFEAKVATGFRTADFGKLKLMNSKQCHIVNKQFRIVIARGQIISLKHASRLSTPRTVFVIDASKINRPIGSTDCTAANWSNDVIDVRSRTETQAPTITRYLALYIRKPSSSNITLDLPVNFSSKLVDHLDS